MIPLSEGSVVVAAAGSINNAGTITGAAIDWSATFEPYVYCAVNFGVITAAGSAVVDVQGSNVSGSGYVSLGSLAVAGAPAGTQAYSIGALNPYRYTRVVETVSAGSATMSATFIGKPRTL